MKQGMMIIVFACCCGRSHAQVPVVGIVTSTIKRVIKAIDLKIQRMQNETIWLQQAQKAVENTMSQLKLEEISTWTEKQRKLYADYFDELYKVKNAIATYQRVKDIIATQRKLIASYNRSWDASVQDNHFTAEELQHIARVYKGILEQCVEGIDQLALLVNAFVTQLEDGQRLALIEGIAAKLQQCYHDLRQFSEANTKLSLMRSRDAQERKLVQLLYGLQQ